MALDHNTGDNPYRLIQQADQLSYGAPEKAALLERAISAADRLGSVEAQFEARLARLSCASFGGEHELTLALFAWCQRTADDRPDVIAPDRMLWYYKFVLVELPKFARISQSQIDAISVEMERRYEANGANLRAVYAKRAELASLQGKMTQAGHLWQQAMHYPRDRYADCKACEQSNSLHILALQLRFEEALAAGNPILQGNMHCAEVPHGSLPRIMQVQYARGQQDEARKLHEQSYRLIRNNPDFIEEVSMHIEFWVAEQELAKAAQLTLRHLPWLPIATSEKTRFHFFRAVHCLLRAIADSSSTREAKWRSQLYDGLETALLAKSGTNNNTQENTEEAPRLHQLLQHVATTGETLANALDQRNENDYFHRQWRVTAFALA